MDKFWPAPYKSRSPRKWWENMKAEDITKGALTEFWCQIKKEAEEILSVPRRKGPLNFEFLCKGCFHRFLAEELENSRFVPGKKVCPKCGSSDFELHVVEDDKADELVALIKKCADIACSEGINNERFHQALRNVFGWIIAHPRVYPGVTRELVSWFHSREKGLVDGKA